MTDQAFPLWTADEIALATAGAASAPFSATGVSIDTRTLEPGDLFVALSGARDGHEFVAQAMAKGASGVLAARPVDAPHVLVADVFAGLEALGRGARARVLASAPGARRGEAIAPPGGGSGMAGASRGRGGGVVGAAQAIRKCPFYRWPGALF